MVLNVHFRIEFLFGQTSRKNHFLSPGFRKMTDHAVLGTLHLSFCVVFILSDPSSTLHSFTMPYYMMYPLKNQLLVIEIILP